MAPAGGWRFSSAEQERRWSEDPALRAFAAEVAAELARRGAPPEDAARLLNAHPWWEALLTSPSAVLHGHTPDQVAGEVQTARRCAVCGHPLHRAAGDVLVPAAGASRRVRRLPHIAACSCGYSDLLVDAPWAAALAAYFARHPERREVDAADPELLADLRRALGRP
jgi:hypothetical protein